MTYQLAISFQIKQKNQACGCLNYEYTAKMFGAKIICEQMFGGFLSNHYQILVNNFGENEHPSGAITLK